RRDRSARRAVRTSADLRFLPEMDRGIPYVDLMTEEQVARIHRATLDLLSDKGIEFRDDESLRIWRQAGAEVEGHRVRIDSDLLLHLLASAPETCTMAARNPERSVTLGGRKQIFTPAYGAPNVIDLEGNRRSPALADFHDFVKLAHMSPAMHMSGGVLCEPLDIPVPKRHLHMVYSLIRHSDKPFMGMVTARDRAEDTLTMARILFGEDFLERNTVMTSIANCNSPLVWDRTMLDAVKTYSASNQAILFTPFVLSGASTPASTLGSLVQINAEALAGIAFSQALRPGVPAIYGQWIGAVSMRSGAPMAGTPEICHLTLLVGQLARHYRLPWRCSGSCTSAKTLDAQAGYESARNLYGAVLAGANFILSTTGYMEGALSQSFAKFVVDAEQVEMFYRFATGVDFGELDSALDAMREVEPGGHYLGTRHTLENFERAFMIPELMHHDSFEQWEADGRLDTQARAADKVRQLLSDYEAPKLDEAIDEALRDFIARRERELPDFVT
ncbi:MAG: trimethylamine methyltransferase family protein, partial [Rhodospirillales bacterium]|nr:trimethylamine methyltransferase family protein [Rhodospirillales bacterium]